MINTHKETTANTLGNIAKLYGIGVMVLNDWISEHQELENKINNYCKHVKRNKNAKVLPPILVDEIYKTLGQP